MLLTGNGDGANAGRSATVSRATEPPLPAGMDADVRETISVLFASEDLALRELCGGVLRTLGYAVHVSSRAAEVPELLKRRGFDIAVIDTELPRELAAELVGAVASASASTRAILITGEDAEPAVDPPAGSWAYIAKPFTPQHLELVVERLAHGVVAARRGRALRQEIASSHGFSDKVAVIGRAPAFRHVVDLARRVAPTEAPVFVTGESGCGKEQVAQFIHAHSRRSSKPLVALNCAALPEALLESEMFGHRRGAFTGAVADRPGLLEAADGGTLFLDELTEMPVTLQAKLLRVVQDGHVRRVGSNNTDAVVDVRFIAATNRTPKEAIDSGLLRRDLYYRLRVVPIHIPPLRERFEDIPVLAEYFLEHFWSRHRVGEMPMPVFGEAAMAALQARPWRGNVRELQNTIEHAVVLLDPGQVIQPEDVPAPDDPTATSSPASALCVVGDVTAEAYHIARDRILADFERGYLAWLVERASGNMSKAARIAGVDRTTLYRLMDKHGLQRDVLLTARD